MVLEFLYFGYSPAKNKLGISQSARQPVSQSEKRSLYIVYAAYQKIFAQAAKTGRRSRGFHDDSNHGRTPAYLRADIATVMVCRLDLRSSSSMSLACATRAQTRTLNFLQCCVKVLEFSVTA